MPYAYVQLHCNLSTFFSKIKQIANMLTIVFVDLTSGECNILLDIALVDLWKSLVAVVNLWTNITLVLSFVKFWTN